MEMYREEDVFIHSNFLCIENNQNRNSKTRVISTTTKLWENYLFVQPWHHTYLLIEQKLHTLTIIISRARKATVASTCVGANVVLAQ